MSKKIFALIGLTLSLFVIFTFASLFISSEDQHNDTQAITSVNTVPTILTIPKIDLKASIESVGADELGRMMSPGLDENVAWWSKGAGAGQKGSVVLAGHVDKKEGGPGIFYKLSLLDIGDEIKVKDTDGKDYTYKVTSQKIYDFDKVPMELVFMGNDKAGLNLITCTGSFDAKTQNYSKRLIVFAEM